MTKNIGYRVDTKDVYDVGYQVTNTLNASTSAQYVTIKFVILDLTTGVRSIHPTAVSHQRITSGTTLTGTVTLNLNAYTKPKNGLPYVVIGVLHNDSDAWTRTTRLDYDRSVVVSR